MRNSYNEKKTTKETIVFTTDIACFVSCILDSSQYYFLATISRDANRPQPGGFADCIWSATVQTWVDVNGNGIRDADDPPLPGVTFHVNDILIGYSDVSTANNPTDWKGEVQLSVWLPGCPSARFEIYPDTPTGYNALSNSSPIVDVKSTDQAFDFGFFQLTDKPTVTPRPPSPTCGSYHVGLANRYDITDIAIAKDESVWVATYNDGIRKLPPGSQEWEYINTSNGCINDEVRSIMSFDDGSVWFGTEGGAARLTSNGWETFTKNQGLISNSVYDIAAGSDGDLWFAADSGISYLDVQTMECCQCRWASP